MLVRLRRLGLPVGAVVTVGFSGGADSLALATVLGRVAERGRVRPILLHVDHRLRVESGDEQRSAAMLAAELALPFRALRAANDPRRLHPGVGMEEAARRERFRLLAEATGDEGAAVLALAHHEGDQAETVLLHLLRGAGVAGAAAMGERTTLVVPWWGTEPPASRLQLWRPLLGEPRRVVRAYSAESGLAAVDDPSNDDDAPRRNALRRHALPLLERIVPGATAGLARYARLAAADDALLAEIARSAAGRAMPGDGSLTVAAVAAEPLAVRRRLVRWWLREAAGLAVSADRVEAVLDLLRPGRGGRRVEVGADFAVVARGAGLRVEGGTQTRGEGDEG